MTASICNRIYLSPGTAGEGGKRSSTYGQLQASWLSHAAYRLLRNLTGIGWLRHSGMSAVTILTTLALNFAGDGD